jgi:hypothetical protein
MTRFCLVCAMLMGTLLRAQQGLDNEQILKLVKAGLSDDVIVGMVGTQPGRYSISTNDVIALKSAGVSDTVIAAMVNKRGVVPLVTNAKATPGTPVEPSVSSRGHKVISFAIADWSGLHPGMPGWIGDWIRKNSKNYPNVSFQQGDPIQGAENYLIVLSTSAAALHGFDLVLRTKTRTETSPTSGTGSVTDNFGFHLELHLPGASHHDNDDNRRRECSLHYSVEHGIPHGV